MIKYGGQRENLDLDLTSKINYLNFQGIICEANLKISILSVIDMVITNSNI